MPQTAPCDYFGRSMSINDAIVYGIRMGNSGHVSYGRIIGFDNRKVKIISERGVKKTLLVPEKIIIVNFDSFPSDVQKELGFNET